MRLRLPEIATEMLRADDTDRVYYRVLGARGEHVAGDTDLPVPDNEPHTLDELRFRDDQVQAEPVRVAYLWVQGADASGEPSLVQVAETLGKRSRLTTEIVKGVIIPQFVILPVAVLLVWFALARGIRPLNELQQRIRRRRSEDLSPIDELEAPEEVAPLVRAINDLLAAAGSIDRHAEALSGRCGAPAEDAARRSAHTSRAGAARDRHRPAGCALAQALAAADRALEPARSAHGEPIAVDGPRRRPGDRIAQAGGAPVAAGA